MSKWLLASIGMAAILNLPAAAHEPVSAEPIVIGESLTLTTHDAERRLNVVLPRGYEQGESTYPLILMLDGGLSQDFYLALGVERWNQLWDRSQPAIFVGVETVDRQRELLPTTADPNEIERYPTAGENEQFRTWLLEAVLPLLRKHYRDDGRVFLVGESAAGHFVAETWAKYPDAFDGYAALSPSMQWNDQQLSRDVVAVAGQRRPPFFLSLADEGGATEEGLLRFKETTGNETCFVDGRKLGVHHADALHRLLPQALQFLVPTPADWLAEYGLTTGCEANGDDGP
uniref:alpha/beta hydrolase n=1 Tax=Parerythrobacter lutipelagi TaxID=1964208 RepID=UPI0010F615BF|nr:alpha/beta hydrolase-fold protein [Parerythrobacter lutipelagi]